MFPFNEEKKETFIAFNEITVTSCLKAHLLCLLSMFCSKNLVYSCFCVVFECLVSKIDSIPLFSV